MKTFDLLSREIGEERAEVFYTSEKEEFSARIIQLDKDEEIPPCDMEAYVIFVVMKGGVEVSADGEQAFLSRGESIISPPATMSMQAKEYSRVLGVQVSPKMI